MPLFLPKCISCKHIFVEPTFVHLENGESTKRCKAFPNGIPLEIFENKFDHENPYPGDNGIRFELDDELKEYKPIHKQIHLERKTLKDRILGIFRKINE
ncbi:MAG: hypothetical protein N3A69_07195 [Leptospiraceae bacterium]|nr:hypothetical protein [Leptospiraceae bacterium]